MTLQDCREFQLLALSCLYIAIKINEHAAFSSEHFSTLSRGVCITKEIEDIKIILNRLSWLINGLTSLQIVMYLLLIMGIQCHLSKRVLNHLLNEVKYQSEKAIRDYILSIKRPSTVALKILFKSLKQLRSAGQLVLFCFPR
jgi:hypothetical protein